MIDLEVLLKVITMNSFYHYYPVFVFLVIISTFSPKSSVPLLQAQEVEDEGGFDYIKGSNKGPEKWGYLKEEWAACKNGKMQSPIDLTSKRVPISPALGKLHKVYSPSQAIIKNRGHDIAVEWQGDAGWVEMNTRKYKLVQSHWHSPSEHILNGTRYAMELHMVHHTHHPKAKHKTAVIAMLYKFGRPDPFIAELMKNVTLTSSHGGEEDANKGVKRVDPNEIRVAGQRYYRYIGSLTTPPCTEGVIWTINKRVRTVSRAQLASLREAVHDYAESNARPIQAINGRRVYYYAPRMRPS